MFEGYTHEAREALVIGLEEARALRSGVIGSGHLLLGVVRTLPLLVPLSADDVRTRLGPGQAAEDAGLPFTEAAKRVLEGALREAQRLGHGRVTSAHLLLALAADPEAVELSSLDPARLRDEALRHLVHPPERFDLERALHDGGAVPVWLGDREFPIGDLGHPRVDARLLLAILGKDGRSAGSCASTASTRRPSAASSAAHRQCGRRSWRTLREALSHGAGARRYVGRLAHGLPATPDRLILQAVSAEEMISRAITRPTDPPQGPSIDRG